ncbi:MAG: CotH kinase family protein [Prevotella sp.]|nr:CotH kinase family protein [Prevotella sp.]
MSMARLWKSRSRLLESRRSTRPSSPCIASKIRFSLQTTGGYAQRHTLTRMSDKSDRSDRSDKSDKSDKSDESDKSDSLITKTNQMQIIQSALRMMVAVLLPWWAMATAWAQPKFSKPHGLYEVGTLTLTISPQEEGTEIRYTTDGSEPTAQSLLYSNTLRLTKTTILRAVEVRDGEVVSEVSTASYILMKSVLSQPNNPEGYPKEWGNYTQMWGIAPADYEMDPEMTGNASLSRYITEGMKQLPILSIVSDKNNFFSHENDPERGGIYIFTGPPVGDATGHGWTRPASVELMGGPQQHDLSVNCGIRLHGGHGRLAEKNPKHSFRLVFKKEYGPATLNYPIFGEDEPSQFDQLVLRCHFGNSWQHWVEGNREKAQYARDVWARRMQRKLGHISANALYVHLFLNGMYWGLYNIAERVDDQFGKNHLGGKKSDYDVIKVEEDGGNHLEASEGDTEAWNLMVATAAKAADPSYYQQLDSLLDIDALIDYMLINQYGGNTDWDHHNWYAIRRKGTDSPGFQFLCWDTEIIFENPEENVLNLNNKGYPSGIFHNLMKNGDFAWRYLQRARELLADDGLLGPSQVVEVWDSLYHTISYALYDEAARWGDYRRDVHPYTSRGKLYTVDGYYMAERNRLLTKYFPVRSKRVLNDIVRFVGDIPSGMTSITTPTADTPYYNLNGQPVARPTKGIYIKDGKKVVIH